MPRALVTMPKTAARGEVLEIRTLIAHPMETGYRAGMDGAILPRNIIRRFSCRYFDGHDDMLVFSAELFPAIAANPFIAFSTVATASGVLRFEWSGDNGFVQAESVELTVT
ncbi:MAG TPA: thiosulfate oxidation carrier complex protein SoxZ [Burkholderiaceae bacterium]|jgi:sulfur-oxidizing protein SoxZ